MTHPYAAERVARAAYVEQTRLHLQEALDRPEVQSGLGNTALRLLDYTGGLYVPEVSDDGVVSLPPDCIETDRIPVLALRDDEQMQRDATFASFTPAQYEATDVNAAALRTVAKRMAARTEGNAARITQTFSEDAATMRLTYTISDYPAPGRSTFFNMRPLVLLRYDPESGNTETPIAAEALMQAGLIMRSPTCVVSDAAEFDAFNNRMAEQAQHLGVFLGGFVSKG